MKPQSLAQPTEERIPERRSQLLGPFRFRDFRLLWMGLLVSNLGTWMQFTAMGYLVVHIAPTAAAAALNVGLLGASQSIPALLLSPIAGVVADRYPRRRVLLFTNSTVSLVAAALAVLTLTQHGALWALLVLNGVRAGAQAFDSPARQSWVPLLVPREFVANAIGVNSIAFNAPSIIGPPIAGVIILTIGIWAAFVINAVSTLAVVAALILMHPVPPSSTGREPVFASIRAGLAFLFAHPVLNSVIWLLLITCIFVRPYHTLLPAYAAHVVNVDARGLGILLASG
ncbi:MAG: MFS transporter, partial [Vulcanimicrobiaceae bacterium]